MNASASFVHAKEEQIGDPSSSDVSDDCKVFVSRIPAVFDQDTLRRLVEETLGKASVVDVSLVYPRTSDEHQEGEEKVTPREPTSQKEGETPHRGFGFVTLDSVERQQEALRRGTLRGGAKSTSKKKHTIYLRPVVRDDDTEKNCIAATSSDKRMCFLWAKFRCPYGENCKFDHQGEGGCLEQNNKSSTDEKKKRGKCFAFKKGNCTRGDDCLYSHDFEVPTKKLQQPDQRPDSEKDCIGWKTKGKCNKKDRCPYRHDEEVQKEALRKKEQKKRNMDKVREPLSVRVFGLNYDTTEADVRTFFQDCGPIVEVTFPSFEDSGRSKGYCGVLFQSPKAVAKAVDLSGTELHGRWLSIQAGKMYLKQWEQHHTSRGRKSDESPALGEFGQTSKKRRKHGYAE